MVSPVKVTLTPSKGEGEEEKEPEEQILTLESDGDQAEEKERKPLLWEKALMMTEQVSDYDSEEDPEYVPPAVIIDTDLEYDEVIYYFDFHECINCIVYEVYSDCLAAGWGGVRDLRHRGPGAEGGR